MEEISTVNLLVPLTKKFVLCNLREIYVAYVIPNAFYESLASSFVNDIVSVPSVKRHIDL